MVPARHPHALSPPCRSPSAPCPPPSASWPVPTCVCPPRAASCCAPPPTSCVCATTHGSGSCWRTPPCRCDPVRVYQGQAVLAYQVCITTHGSGAAGRHHRAGAAPCTCSTGVRGCVLLLRINSRACVWCDLIAAYRPEPCVSGVIPCAPIGSPTLSYSLGVQWGREMQHPPPLAPR